MDHDEEDSPTRRDRWVALAVIEMISIAIALAMPITPSKTGSTWRPSSLFNDEPSYLQDVAVWFVLTNLLLWTMLLAAWLMNRRSGRG